MSSEVKKAAKNVRTFVVVFLLGMAVCAAGAYAYRQELLHHAIAFPEGKTSINITVLEEAMDKNNELSTATYLYTDSMSVTDQNTLDKFNLPDVVMPLTQAAYILEFDGTVKAGYDLNNADVKLEGDKKIVVILPPAKVLSHETSDVKLVWEMQNICNPLHASEESGWINEEKAEMESRAISLGLFDEAEQNARATFKALFGETIPDDAELDIRFEA